MLNGFLIDSKNQTVTEVQVKEMDIQGINDLIGSDVFTVSMVPFNDDLSDIIIYVDDEGLLKNPESFFQVRGGSILAGNGLVLGDGPDGRTVSCPVSKEKLSQYVIWYG